MTARKIILAKVRVSTDMTKKKYKKVSPEKRAESLGISVEDLTSYQTVLEEAIEYYGKDNFPSIQHPRQVLSKVKMYYHLYKPTTTEVTEKE